MCRVFLFWYYDVIIYLLSSPASQYLASLWENCVLYIYAHFYFYCIKWFKNYILYTFSCPPLQNCLNSNQPTNKTEMSYKILHSALPASGVGQKTLLFIYQRANMFPITSKHILPTDKVEAVYLECRVLKSLSGKLKFFTSTVLPMS